MNTAKSVTTVKCYSTIGLNAVVPTQITRKLVRIAHDKLSDGNWEVYVESGNNGAVYKSLGIKILSDDEIRQLFDDDNVQEFKNLAALFDIAI